MSWTEFVTFWEGMGWLANALEILGAAIGLVLFVWGVWRFSSKYYFSFRHKSVEHYMRAKLEAIDNVSEIIVRESKILIVDDQPEDFPISHLKKSGFDVDVKTQVPLAEAGGLDKYDVVFMDIANVVPEDPRHGGLELIRRLKRSSNHPAIIAVSAKTFDPISTSFFQSADAILNKPIKEIPCEDKLRDVLLQKFSPIEAARRVDHLIQSSAVTAHQQSRVVRQLIRQIESKGTLSSIAKVITEQYGMAQEETVKRDMSILLRWINRRRSNRNE